jgi:hypothetical protein
LFFCGQLKRLAFGDTASPLLFFWLEAAGRGWDSERLTRVFKCKASTYFETFLTIQSYRYIAIGISRTHLACSGFKRDYEVENATIGAQTAHIE